MKYLSRTKSVLKMATEREWIPTNPIASFKCSFIERDPLRLELHELETLYNKEIKIRRLEEARDIYVFMCYTGFAYIDTFQLTGKNIFWGIDKRKSIARDRQKTDGTECVPLLEIPLEILQKYKDHPYCLNSGKLLPVNSNQRFNAYLKEIADICGIEKELTTHTGRHTFATTVTLENDVPLETVGKMLGHRSIRSTQRYARVTKKKISNNMNELRLKLNAVPRQSKTGS
jgi:site-specific recombinase XerD